MIPYLLTIALLAASLTGCFSPDHGVVRTESNDGSIYWNIPTPLPFADGDEKITRQICGYVLNKGGYWIAAAYPDKYVGPRYYHTKPPAVAYVEQWCKP